MKPSEMAELSNSRWQNLPNRSSNNGNKAEKLNVTLSVTAMGDTLVREKQNSKCQMTKIKKNLIMSKIFFQTLPPPIYPTLCDIILKLANAITCP